MRAFDIQCTSCLYFMIYALSLPSLIVKKGQEDDRKFGLFLSNLRIELDHYDGN